MRQASTYNARVFFVLILLASQSLYAEPITLFFPGQSSLEWLLSDHDGAKKFRKGSSCLSCHEDEEAEMAKNTLKQQGGQPTNSGHLTADLQFSRNSKDLQLVIKFTAPKTDFTLSFMFDDERTSAFQRAGCWSSCHADMKGMPADSGQAKYLGKSRSKLSRTGGGSQLRLPEDLLKLKADGVFVELWEIQVGTTADVKVEQFSLLEQPKPIQPTVVKASAVYADGQWTLTVSRAINIKGLKSLGMPSQTFGIALHLNTEGYRHRVTLPKRFGTTADSDYKVKIL